MGLELKNLVEKLNPCCKKSLEAAAALCVQKTNYNVELEHFIYRLLQQPDCDIDLLLKYYEIDKDSVQQHLLTAINKFKNGCTAAPTLSPNIILLLEKSWMITSIQLSQQKIRSAAMLLGIIDTDALRGILLESCPLVLRIPRHTLHEDLIELIRVSPENKYVTSASSSIEPLTTGFSTPAISAGEALKKYASDYLNFFEKLLLFFRWKES